VNVLDEGEGVFEVEDGHAVEVPFSSRNLKNSSRKKLRFLLFLKFSSNENFHKESQKAFGFDCKNVFRCEISKNKTWTSDSFSC